MAFAFLVIVLLIGIDIQQKGADVLTRKTEGGITMAEYIERETALEIISDMGVSSLSRVAVCDVLNKIEKIPTADVAPVVHGRWINGGMTCSTCKQGCKDTTNPHKPVPVFLGNMPYCPKCGAKMDGGETNG